MSNSFREGSFVANLGRRKFLAVSSATLSLAASSRLRQVAFEQDSPVRICVIADLHHDLMHDGMSRMESFVERVGDVSTNAVLQLGDFAYPNAKNRKVIDLFNQAHEDSLHVIGNHDMDAGHTKQQCLDVWGMPGRFYTKNIDGVSLIVLDGNESGSPTHRGGYRSYVGEEQLEWLKEQLDTISGPILIASHQPLAGPMAVDNAEAVQKLLGTAKEKILLAINGHSHIDYVTRVEGVTHMHVNSAAYKWVGGKYRHKSYSDEVHQKYPAISSTCPYRNSLHAVLTIDPQSGLVSVEGSQSEWVGDSPAQLGADSGASLTDGEEVAPRIRDRRLVRIAR